MKLNIKGCREYCKASGIKNYLELSMKLGVNISVIKLFECGGRIGYEAVKKIYNELGEKIVCKIIEFEEETLDGFKSKYILIGLRLY